MKLEGVGLGIGPSSAVSRHERSSEFGELGLTQLRPLLEASGQALIVLDDDDAIVFASSAAFALLASSSARYRASRGEALEQQSLREHVTIAAPALPLLVQACDGLQHVALESADGRRFVARLQVLRDRRTTPTHVCLTLDAPRVAAPQAPALEALGRLAAELGHEINNQLAAALNYASIVQRRVGAADESAPAVRGAAADESAPALRGAAANESAPALRGGAADKIAPALRGGAADKIAPALRGGAPLIEPEHLEELQQALWRASGWTASLRLVGRQRSATPESLRIDQVLLELEPLLRHVAGAVNLHFDLDAARSCIEAPRAYFEQVVIGVLAQAFARSSSPKALTMRTRLLSVGEGGDPIVRVSCETHGEHISNTMSAAQRGAARPRGTLRRALKRCNAKLHHDSSRIWVDFPAQ